MVFHNESINSKVLFEELDIGDVFVDDEQQVFMKIEFITSDEDCDCNAVRLKDGKLVYFHCYDYLYYAEADLHYIIQA